MLFRSDRKSTRLNSSHYQPSRMPSWHPRGCRFFYAQKKKETPKGLSFWYNLSMQPPKLNHKNYSKFSTVCSFVCGIEIGGFAIQKVLPQWQISSLKITQTLTTFCPILLYRCDYFVLRKWRETLKIYFKNLKYPSTMSPNTMR